jgi:mono/diheme cytochrome c family protein
VFGDETAVEAPTSVGDINEPDEQRRDTVQDETSTRNVPQADAQLVATGQKLYEESRCQNCHRNEGKGRANGPDLTKVGRRLPDINWHIEHLKNPQKVRPDSTMPSYEELSPGELKALSTYLVSLK